MYQNSLTDRIKEGSGMSKREAEKQTVQNDMIAQAIYEDFETIKDKKEKYGIRDTDELSNILSGLIEKYGRDKVKIFIKSEYFEKCADRSILEVLFPENSAI